jgi:hypothetical protein
MTHVLVVHGSHKPLMWVCECLRCGARRFPDMGERMPAECSPKPEWLREHPEEKR